MSLDTTRLGQIAAEMMESLAESYVEHDVEVGEVVLVVEVRSGDWTAVTYRCTDDRVWVQQGLLRAGVHAVEEAKQRVDPGDDDEESD